MVIGEFYQGIGELEGVLLRYFLTDKEMVGGSAVNSESVGKFLTGDIVEKLGSRREQVPRSRCSVETFG